MILGGVVEAAFYPRKSISHGRMAGEIETKSCGLGKSLFGIRNIEHQAFIIILQWGTRFRAPEGLNAHLEPRIILQQSLRQDPAGRGSIRRRSGRCPRLWQVLFFPLERPNRLPLLPTNENQPCSSQACDRSGPQRVGWRAGLEEKHKTGDGRSVRHGASCLFRSTILS